jgi:excisionase family DNA binding protein
LLYPVGYNRGMAKKIDPDEYVRIGTAAAIAGVTRAYINRLISQGRLPAIRIDGQNFVRRLDAENFAISPKN